MMTVNTASRKRNVSIEAIQFFYQAFIGICNSFRVIVAIEIFDWFPET